MGTANLEFWETYKNTEVGNIIYEKLNDIISRNKYPGYADSIEGIANDSSANMILTSDTLESGEVAIDTSYSELDSSNNPLASLSEEEQQEVFRKTSPFSARLFPYSNQQNQWVESSILGSAKITDTADVNEYLNMKEIQTALSSVRNLDFMWESKSSFSTEDGTPMLNLFLIKKTKSGNPLLDGEEVESARQDFDPLSRKPLVSLQFKSAGAIAWADLTEKSFTDQTGIAVTLDRKVFSSPVASERIEGGRTQISGGSFSGPGGLEEARKLASILKAGALPAPSKIVDEAFVGPTLGAENVQNGLWSFAGALLLVLLYMIFYYAKAGIVADIALIANIFFIFGTLASLGAALTLPGIAGIVLTIGMGGQGKGPGGHSGLHLPRRGKYLPGGSG